MDNGGDLDEAVAVFVRVRPRLLAIAHRILASSAETEDVVQEVWVRWQKVDRTMVENPQALLATMTTRLAINAGQCAWRRREICVACLEPEAVDTTDDPAAKAENNESVEQAVLLMMTALNPKERAAYLLREAFGYPYRQISETLHLGTANARQLVSRARRHLATASHSAGTTPSHHCLLTAFLNAARSGDLPELEALLTADLAS